MIRIRRALVSVSDKRGVDELARGLARHGVEILSTGGTARALRDAGARVTEVAAYTGAPEILDGRVKTLHPKIHGGLLGRATPEHEAEMAEARDRADRSRGREPLSVPRDDGARQRRRSPRRSRTSTSAGRRCCARRRRTTSASRWSSIPTTTRRCIEELDANDGQISRGAALPPRAQGVRPHRGLRRRDRRLADRRSTTERDASDDAARSSRSPRC